MARTCVAKICSLSSPKASQTVAVVATVVTQIVEVATVAIETAEVATVVVDPWTAMSVDVQDTLPEIAPNEVVATVAVVAETVVTVVTVVDAEMIDVRDVAPEATVHVRDHDLHRMVADKTALAFYWKYFS